MPRPLRIQFPGAFYHVYNRGVEKRPIVRDDRDRRTFMQLLSESVKKYRLRLFAYCLMDNHFHLFFQITEKNLSEAMWKLLAQFVSYINLRYDRVGPLFQGRFRSRLVQTDLYAHVLARYIHQNPAEAGRVERLEDFSWSSYPCYLGKIPKWDWLETEWLLKQFHPNPTTAMEIFRQFHAEKPSAAEKEKLDRISRPLTSTARDLALFPTKGAWPR